MLRTSRTTAGGVDSDLFSKVSKGSTLNSATKLIHKKRSRGEMDVEEKGRLFRRCLQGRGQCFVSSPLPVPKRRIGSQEQWGNGNHYSPNQVVPRGNTESEHP